MNTKSSEIIETARSIRTCPPPGKRSGKGWQKHIGNCPICRDEINDSAGEGVNAVWEDMAGYLSGFFDTKPARPEPAIGELWQINPEKGRWLTDCYLSPPAVLITDISSSGRTADCLVIYPDTDPAAPGDIILDEDETGFMDLFVETWNRIIIRMDDLSARLGAVSDQCLEDIKKYAENHKNIPKWAMIPVAIRNENDPRNEFRKIEKITAAAFSLKPLEVLMGKTASFLEFIRSVIPGYSVNDFQTDQIPISTVTESALKFRFPESMTPAYAHAGQGDMPADWRVMVIKDERMVNFFPSRAEIETDEIIDGRRTISGRSEILQDHEVFRLIACLASNDGMIDAEMADMDDDGFFSVEFDVTDVNDADSAQPVFCVIYEKR